MNISFIFRCRDVLPERPYQIYLVRPHIELLVKMTVIK
jgi:hypothetical protein